MKFWHCQARGPLNLASFICHKTLLKDELIRVYRRIISVNLGNSSSSLHL